MSTQKRVETLFWAVVSLTLCAGFAMCGCAAAPRPEPVIGWTLVPRATCVGGTVLAPVPVEIALIEIETGKFVSKRPLSGRER